MGAVKYYDEEENEEDYDAVSRFSTEYETFVGSEWTSVIKTNRNFWHVLLLSIVTGGLYLIYFFAVSGRDLNLIARKDGRKTTNFILIFILTIFLFGIIAAYPIYFFSFKDKGEDFLMTATQLQWMDFLVIFVTSIIAFTPLWIWLYNFTSRIDNELQRRKTSQRLPVYLFFWFALSIPQVANALNVICFLFRDYFPSVLLLRLSGGFFGSISVLSALYYIAKIIPAMNTLSRCTVYCNVEYQ